MQQHAVSSCADAQLEKALDCWLPQFMLLLSVILTPDVQACTNLRCLCSSSSRRCRGVWASLLSLTVGAKVHCCNSSFSCSAFRRSHCRADLQ